MKKTDFWQKVLSGQERPRSSKNTQKMKFYFFGGGLHTSNPIICTSFTRMWKCMWSSTFLQKSTCPGKIWFVVHSKNFYTNENAWFMHKRIIHNISRGWGRKLNLFMWLHIHRSNKFRQSFKVSVVRHVCTCSKLCRMMS